MTKKLNFIGTFIMLFLMFVTTAFSQPFTGINPLPGKIGYIVGLAPNDPITGPSVPYLKVETPNSNPLFPGQVKIFKSLRLEYTTSPDVGVLYMGAASFLHNYGGDNMFLGSQAGNFTMTGFLNTGMGLLSLNYNTSGSGNTALGNYALRFNTSGSGNTATGHQSLKDNTTGDYNAAFGGNTLVLNTTGDSNTAIGLFSLSQNTIGNNNTALGYQSGRSITTGSNNTAIGYNAQVPNATGSNQVRIGNSEVTQICGQVNFTVCSDSRWKSNILNSNLGLDFVSKLRPVSYTRNNDVTQKTEYGFIAQEIENELKEAGVENSGIVSIDDNGMYAVRYNDLLAPMVKAIQELKEKNDILSQNNERLALSNENLKSEVESLKLMNEKIVKLEKTINEMASVKNTSLIEKEVNSVNSK